jgi:hypothetical protein
MPGAADDWQYHPWLWQYLRSVIGKYWLGLAQPGFHMPATPALFSPHPNAFDTLLAGPRRSFAAVIGKRLTAWLDTHAPEGYEDETGFHPLPVRSPNSRAPLGDLNCLGEHI